VQRVLRKAEKRAEIAKFANLARYKCGESSKQLKKRAEIAKSENLARYNVGRELRKAEKTC